MSNVATSGSESPPSHDTEPFPNDSSAPSSPGAFSSADERPLGNHTIRRVSVSAGRSTFNDATFKSGTNGASYTGGGGDSSSLPFASSKTPIQQQSRTPTNAGRSRDPVAQESGISSAAQPERATSPSSVVDSGRTTPTVAAIASLMSGFTQLTGQPGAPVPGPVVEAIADVVEDVTEAAGWRLNPIARYVLIVICCVAFSVGSLYISSLIASHSSK